MGPAGIRVVLNAGLCWDPLREGNECVTIKDVPGSRVSEEEYSHRSGELGPCPDGECEQVVVSSAVHVQGRVSGGLWSAGLVIYRRNVYTPMHGWVEKC